MARVFFVFSVVFCVGFVNSANPVRKSGQNRLGYIDDDRIVFPGMVSRSRNERVNYGRNNSIQQMSVSLARRFNEINDIEKFLELYVDNKNAYYEDVKENPVILGARFGIDTKPRSGPPPIAKQAGCLPELTVVSLIPENVNSNAIHLPSCTRVARCGGCCNNALLSCQPIETHMKTFRIYELVHRVNKPAYSKLIPISVEEHLKCSCDCTIKEKDCNSLQVYNKNECKCSCIDLDAKQECSKRNDRYWDDTTCTCVCYSGSGCSTGSFFNSQTCSCK